MVNLPNYRQKVLEEVTQQFQFDDFVLATTPRECLLLSYPSCKGGCPSCDTHSLSSTCTIRLQMMVPLLELHNLLSLT